MVDECAEKNSFFFSKTLKKTEGATQNYMFGANNFQIALICNRHKFQLKMSIIYPTIVCKYNWN